MKIKIPEQITRGFGKTKLWCNSNKAEIFLAASIITAIGSTVYACFATTKAEKMIEQKKKDIETINEFADAEHAIGSEPYTEEDRKNDIRIVKVKTAMGIAGIYLPALALTTLSIMLARGSYNTMKQRNAELAATLAMTTKAFNDYRKQVAEKYGEEEDKLFMNEIKKTVAKDAETGLSSTELALDPALYARYYGPKCRGYIPGNPDYNINQLECFEREFNNLLRVRGYVYLNDVYEALHLPKSPTYGQVAGWVWNASDNKENYIDLGIMRDEQQLEDFMAEKDDSILLTFNCRPNIHNILCSSGAL